MLVTAWLGFGTCLLKFEWFDSTDPAVNQRSKIKGPSSLSLSGFIQACQNSKHICQTERLHRTIPHTPANGLEAVRKHAAKVQETQKYVFFLWWSDKSYGRKFKDPCFFLNYGLRAQYAIITGCLQFLWQHCGCHWIHVLRSSRNQSFKINIWCLCRSFDPNPNNMFEMTINALAEGFENSVVWSCPFSCWPNHPNMEHISPDRVPPPSSKRVILHRLQTRGVTSTRFLLHVKDGRNRIWPIGKK